MNMPANIFSGEVINNVVISLMHSFWQGALIAIILWVYLKRASKQAARVRYRVCFIAMIVLITAVIVTYSTVSQHKAANGEQVTQVQAGEKAGDAESIQVTGGQKSVGKSDTALTKEKSFDLKQSGKERAKTEQAGVERSGRIEAIYTRVKANWQQMVFAVYAAGVAVMLLRVFLMIGGTWRLRKSAREEKSGRLLEIFEETAKKMQMAGKAILAVSDKVIIPCTIGFIRPMVLMPVSVLSGLDEGQIRAIIAHELMHIKRHDWIENIMQMFIEAVLFYNPGMWWISRRIDIEREAACDEEAVGQTNEPLKYGRMLVEFAKSGGIFEGAMSFAGSKQSSLSERVRRLIVPGEKSAGLRPGVMPAIAVFVLITVTSFSFQKGTETTLKYLGKYHSPEKRIEAMKQISKDYTWRQGQNDLYGEGQKVIVRGRLVREDGNNLPPINESCEDFDANSLDITLQLTPYEKGRRDFPEIKKDGTFEIKTRLKKFYIIAEPSRDFAANFYGPFAFDPCQVVEGLMLPVKTGFVSKIKFVDEANKPISGVKISGGNPRPPSYDSYGGALESTSGEDGIAEIKNTADEPASFTCTADGFVKDERQKIRLNPDKPYVWQLKKAVTARLKIISAKDGKAIKGAKAGLQGKGYSEINTYLHKNSKRESGEDGIVELKSLSEDQTYLGIVSAEGYQRKYFKIGAGEAITVELDDFKAIKGKIKGDLGGLKKDKKGTYFEIGNSFKTNSNSTFISWGNDKIYVSIVDSNEANFEIDKYYGQEVLIRIGDRGNEYTIKVDEDDLSNVVIDIAPLSSFPKQKVFFEFVSAGDMKRLDITGKFNVLYKDNPNSHYTNKHDVDIVNGKAEVEIYMPNQVGWEPKADIGWYFGSGHKQIDENYAGSELIECYPAGAIYGKINNPLGEPTRVYMEIREVKHSALLGKTNFVGFHLDFERNIQLNSNGTYNISPVPLGGEYAICIHGNNMYWESQVIGPSEKRPICEMDIVLPKERAEIRGKVSDEDGRPIGGVNYSLDIKGKYSGILYNNGNSKTDREGNFKFEEVSPDDSLKYKVNFDAKGYAKKNYEIRFGKENRIKLEKSPVVKGRVFDEATKKPEAGVTISFWSRGKSSGEYYGFDVESDQGGYFTADQFGDCEYTYNMRKEGYGISYKYGTNRINPKSNSELELYFDKGTKEPAHR